MFSQVQVRLNLFWHTAAFSLVARKSESQPAAGPGSAGWEDQPGADGGDKEGLLLALLSLINKRVLRK